MGRSGHFDWLQFSRGCHPSPVGYLMIAANVADAAVPLLATAVAELFK